MQLKQSGLVTSAASKLMMHMLDPLPLPQAPSRSFITDTAPASHNGQNLPEYPPGLIPATGCITVQIVLRPISLPLTTLLAVQYADSLTMSRRPGMYVKYFPYFYDPVGKIFTGGAYLFDTYENAKDYVRFVNEHPERGKEGGMVDFAKQPVFESCEGRAWKVLGAASFSDIESHAVGRLVSWSCERQEEGIEEKLRGMYPQLKKSAEAKRLASVWLLYDPESGDIGLQMGFKRRAGCHVDHEGAIQTLEEAKEFAALAEILEREISGLVRTFDRTSLLLTLWVPKSSEGGGVDQTIPWYPLVPDIPKGHA